MMCNGMDDMPYDRDAWERSEEYRELMRKARARVPVLQEIAAENLAEIKRLQDEYARRLARRRRWSIFG